MRIDSRQQAAGSRADPSRDSMKVLPPRSPAVPVRADPISVEEAAWPGVRWFVAVSDRAHGVGRANPATSRTLRALRRVLLSEAVFLHECPDRVGDVTSARRCRMQTV